MSSLIVSVNPSYLVHLYHSSSKHIFSIRVENSDQDLMATSEASESVCTVCFVFILKGQ